MAVGDQFPPTILIIKFFRSIKLTINCEKAYLLTAKSSGGFSTGSQLNISIFDVGLAGWLAGCLNGCPAEQHLLWAGLFMWWVCWQLRKFIALPYIYSLHWPIRSQHFQCPYWPIRSLDYEWQNSGFSLVSLYIKGWVTLGQCPSLCLTLKDRTPKWIHESHLVAISETSFGWDGGKFKLIIK